jgi:hypothetical protein
MPSRSQSVHGVGNGDASLSAVGAGGRWPDDGRDSGVHDGSSDTAGPPREGCVVGPSDGTRKSSIDVPGHTTSRCSKPPHKSRRGSGGSPVVEGSWPLRTWTFPPKLGILNSLGEKSPGPLAGGGEVVISLVLAVSRGFVSLILSALRNLPASRAHARGDDSARNGGSPSDSSPS